MSQITNLNANNFKKVIRLYKEQKKDFQRLEFLGDRVLGLSIAEYLFSRFTNYDEGKLAKIYAFLTSKNTLAKIGRNIGIYKFLKNNKIENISDRIVSDFFEALLGYIFLDLGFDNVKTIILNCWSEDIIKQFDLKLDYKTNLQEWTQSKKLGLPKYILIKKEGPDHKPKFVVKVKIKDYSVKEGTGRTLQLAQQNAAKQFISYNIISNEKQ